MKAFFLFSSLAKIIFPLFSSVSIVRLEFFQKKKESGSKVEISDFPPPLTSSAQHLFRLHRSRRGGRLRSEGAEESVTEGRCSLVCFDEDCEDAGRAELSGDRGFSFSFLSFYEGGRPIQVWQRLSFQSCSHTA